MKSLRAMWVLVIVDSVKNAGGTMQSVRTCRVVRMYIASAVTGVFTNAPVQSGHRTIPPGRSTLIVVRARPSTHCIRLERPVKEVEERMKRGIALARRESSSACVNDKITTICYVWGISTFLGHLIISAICVSVLSMGVPGRWTLSSSTG